MKDNSFLATCGALVAITIIGVFYMFTSYWKDYNTKIVELIGDGVDPVAVVCALQNDFGTMPVCLILAEKGKQAARECGIGAKK